MLRRFARLGAWAMLVLFAYATLCPLKDRPLATRDPQQERSSALLLLGTAFGFA